MLNTVKQIPAILKCRFLHTTTICPGVEKAMVKVMKTQKKRKPYYDDVPTLPHSDSFTKVMVTKAKGTKRRVNVLNKLFMRHISDLMTTGEMSSIYAGLGLEINRVEVTPNYDYVNVFWTASTSTQDKKIEKLLVDTSFQLRHELSQLKVIGNVPRIQFIRDRQYADMMAIDARLARADFGEDHVPTEPILLLKTTLQLNTNIEKSIKEKIYMLENNLPLEEQEDLPEMPQNVFGLDHSDIMIRIKSAMNKTVAKHRATNMENNNTEGTQSHVTSINDNPIEYTSAKQQREAFSKFLAERQILKKKIRRAQESKRPELEYLEEEYLTRRESLLDSIKLPTFDELDYIDEDDGFENIK